MPLNNINLIPPGGWQYDQKDEGGRVLKKFSSMSPFKQFCGEVLAFRTANKLAGATVAQVQLDVDNAQCDRLGNDPRWCQKKTVQPFTQLQRRFKQAQENVRRAVTLFSNGVKTLLDWGDDGFVPVRVDEAQGRSDVCTGRTDGSGCPHNRQASYPVVGDVADTIRSHVEKKQKLRLSVLGEENLNSCDLCRCDLKLKVWVPLETILSHMDERTKNDIKEQWPQCWMNQKQTSS